MSPGSVEELSHSRGQENSTIFERLWAAVIAQALGHQMAHLQFEGSNAAPTETGRQLLQLLQLL